MRHGSLESGIGMFDYAAEMMGWGNVFHCEKEEFCQTILKYYWPKAKSYANVFGFNGYEWRGKVDIITAGFPCQPFSNAGKRKGSEDDRHIWPENMRIFREAQPAFIVCENVPGLITIEDGMVFEQVCLDLENEGYEVQTFIIPAVSTNKDHRRDRIWIVAYSNSNGQRNINGLKQDPGTQGYSEGEGDKWERIRDEFRRKDSIITDTTIPGLSQSGQTRFSEFQKETITGLHDRPEQCDRDATDALRIRQQRQGQYRRPSDTEANEDREINRTLNGNQLKESWLEAATRLCTLDDGNAGRLDLAAISKSKWRTESLKAAGNTIVWEIAYNIFKAIEETIKMK